MDGLDLSGVGLPAVTGICAAIAIFTVAFISKLREALYKRVKVTVKTPGWVWFGLALIVPVVICVVLNLDWFQALINTAAGEGKLAVSLDGYGSIPTGVMTAIGSNGSFELLRKKGLVTTKPSSQDVSSEAKDSQNGTSNTQNGISADEATRPVEQPTTNPVSWPTARPLAHVLKEVRPADRKLYYIALDPLDGPLYSLATSRENLREGLQDPSRDDGR